MKPIVVVAAVLLIAALAPGAAAQVTVPKEKTFHVADLPTKDLAEGIHNQAVTGTMAMMLFNHLEKGSKAPVHNHANEQFTYVVEGRLKFLVEDRVHILGPGDVIVVPSFVVHSAEALEDTRTIEAFAPPHAAFLDIAK